MGFFDDIGKKVSDAGQKTLQKTKEGSETVKMNSLIAEEEKRIAEMYSQIGNLYVSKYGEDCEEDFSALVKAVLESRKKIQEYQNEIQDIKGVKKCEKCGSDVRQGAAFCTVCGEPMAKTKEPKNEAEKVCPNCGAKFTDNLAFCTSCGTKLEDKTNM